MSASEIRAKINSIKSTQKITRAMEMVAASKMRKTEQRMSATRPYTDKVVEVIRHLLLATPDYRHPFYEKREVRNVAYLVVGSDRGLCGGLNNNLFKKLLEHGKAFDDKGIGIKFATIGRKAELFLLRSKANIMASVTEIGDTPSLSSFIGVIKVLLDSFINKDIDAIYLIHNKFINTMKQEPTVIDLLPIVAMPETESLTRVDYIYEPGGVTLLNQLLRRFVDSLVYQAVVENVACEQAARMVAMKSASDNAGDLIDEFELIYNKTRQAAITKELSEIVAGAAAV